MSEPDLTAHSAPDLTVLSALDAAVPADPVYDADIRNARRYERIMAAKSLISLALVVLVIEIYLYYH